MVPNFVPLYGLVIVLFSLAYFFLASITFLFVRLEIPEVLWLFRGLFNAYFWMVGIAGLIATAALALSNHGALAAAMLLLATTAITAREWTIQRIDAQHSAFQSGDSGAIRRLRLIHWSVMLANVLIIAAVAESVPYIV